MDRANLLNGKIEWLSKYLKSKELGALPSLYEFGVPAITMGESGSYYFFQKISPNGEISNATISSDVDFAELLYWEAFLRAGELKANAYEHNAGYAELLIERYSSYHTRLFSQALATLGYRAVPMDERDYGILSKSQHYSDIIQNDRQICFSQPTLPIEMLAQHEPDRKKAEALFNKGMTSKKEGKREKYLLKSAEYTYSPAYTALAQLYERMGKKDEAIKWHEKAAEEPYFRLESLKWLAEFYKGTQKEIEYLEKIADYYSVFETPEDYFFVPEYTRILFRLAKGLVSQLNEQYTNSLPLEINKAEKAEKCFVTIISLGMPADEADESELLNQARLMYARLLFEGEIIPKNERLAYTLYRLSTSVDKDLSQRIERYREEELVRLDEILARRINKDYKWLLELKAKHDAYLSAKKLEDIKAKKEAEEKAAHVEALRIEAEKKSKEDLEKKQKDIQQMRDSFKLCDNAEFERPKGGRTSTHEKAVELYKNALNAQEEQDILHILMEASKLGHPKAMASLAHYYTNKDNKKAGEWMLRALDAGCGMEAVKGVDPGLDFDTAFAYANDYYGKSQHEKWSYGMIGKEALSNFAQKKLTAEQLQRMIDAANQGHVFALEIMIPYLKRSDSAMATEFTYMLAEKGNADLIKDIIKKNGDVSANSLPRYVRFLQSDRVKKHDIAMFQIAQMLIDEEIANKFGVRYSPEDGVKMLHRIEKTKEHGLKRRVHLALGEAYRTGKGAEQSMWMAAQYYGKYDPALAKECLSKHFCQSAGQQYESRQLEKGMEWLKKYPCPELERKLALNSTKAKNIILQYGECADKITEQEIIERDRLLKLGFSIEELYDQKGFFNAWKMQKQIEKRQAASDTAEIIENVKSIETSIESVRPEQSANTEGTVNIVFYSDFKEDPRTTSRDWYTPIREENDIQRSILKRERERLNKPDMATKILFAVERVVVNGEQVNSEVFFDHLTLTLKPGIYNIQVRCYCKYYFAGWHPGDGIEIDRWPDYRPKDVAKNVRKTLELTVEVKPGKTHYLGYFVRMYGEWEDYYNLIGLFNHKYLKKVDVNFSFDEYQSEKALLRKVNSYSIRGGFITLEDIGKPEYSIPEFMV